MTLLGRVSNLRRRFRTVVRPLTPRLFGQYGDAPETTVVYDDFPMKCESWETGKRDLRTVPVKLTDLVRTDMPYRIKFLKGDAPLANAHYIVKVWVNGNLYVQEDLYDNPRFTQEVTGNIDLSGIVTENTDIEIGMTNAPGQWGQMEFDIDLINYYPLPPPPQKTLTITIDGGGYTVPGAGSYDVDEHSTAQVKATPFQGYDFVHWLRGAYVVTTNSTVSVVMDTDISLTAVFKAEDEPDPEPEEPECSLMNPPPTGYKCVDGKIVKKDEPPENGNGNGNGNGEPEEPVTETIHLFDDVHLKSMAWDVAKKSTKTFKTAPDILAGGYMQWSISHLKGNDPSVNARIRLNDEVIREGFIPWGGADSGTIDLTGKLLPKNTVEIWFGSDPALWSELVFDIVVVLTYLEDPGPTCPFPMFLPRFLTGGDAPILCAAHGMVTGSKR